MHALVTGAGGFVGSRLCARLTAQGWQVSGLDVPGTPPAAGCANWAGCDITSGSDVRPVLRRIPPITHLFHLAALTFVPDAQKNPESVSHVNVEGTRTVMESVFELCPSARLILVSSADIYGPPDYLPMDEIHPVRPQNAYARSKAEAETWCRRFRAETTADLVVMRPFNHTGPGQSEKFVLPAFARQVARIEAGLQPPVIQVGNLESARDFSHVDDVIRAYELAARLGSAGETYNVCSGVSVRVGEALDRLLSLGTAKITIQTDRARLRPAESTQVRGSYQKLSDATGWKPEIAFETLLQDLLAYWRNKPE